MQAPNIESFGNKKLKQAFIISIVFFIIEFVVVQFHEVWRDEIETWAIGMNSHSISELFYNGRYEGHPKLWFLMLYTLQFFTHNIYYMQVLHVCVATATVFVFSYFSPFNFVKNILFCFGYFFAYEYSIISRNYGIEVLLLFLISGLFLKHRGKYLILISLLFFLMLQTNLYANIISIVFYPFILFSLYQSKSLKPLKLIISILILIPGFIFSIISMIPPDDSGVVLGWKTTYYFPHIISVFSTMIRSYIPISAFMHDFWNSSFLDHFRHRDIMEVILIILLIFSIVVLFYRDKKVLLLFWAGTIGLLLFTYTKNYGALRHHGHLYLVFVLCLWLCFYEKKDSVGSDKFKSVFMKRCDLLVRKYFINILLIIQLYATCRAFISDIRYPFSNAMAASEYIKSNSLDTMKLIGDSYPQTVSVAGLLNDEIYCPRSKKWCRYIIWDNSRTDTAGDCVKRETEKLSAQTGSDIILILTYPAKNKPGNWKLLKSFEGALIWDENYFIYRVSPDKM